MIFHNVGNTFVSMQLQCSGSGLCECAWSASRVGRMRSDVCVKLRVFACISLDVWVQMCVSVPLQFTLHGSYLCTVILIIMLVNKADG